MCVLYYLCDLLLLCVLYYLRTNDSLCVSGENGFRDKTLQRDYHNQRRYAKRQGFDWWDHSGYEDWLFRDA